MDRLESGAPGQGYLCKAARILDKLSSLYEGSFVRGPRGLRAGKSKFRDRDVTALERSLIMNVNLAVVTELWLIANLAVQFSDISAQAFREHSPNHNFFGNHDPAHRERQRSTDLFQSRGCWTELRRRRLDSLGDSGISLPTYDGEVRRRTDSIFAILDLSVCFWLGPKSVEGCAPKR